MLPASSPVFGGRACLLNERKTAELLPLIEAAFAAGGYFRLWPRGRSMRPLLRAGVDSVLLGPPGDVQLYDILLVRAEDGVFLLHRAVRIGEEGVTLAGDNLLSTEGPFPREAILARVVKVYRGDGELDPHSPRLLRYAKRRILRRRILCLLGRAKRSLLK